MYLVVMLHKLPLVTRRGLWYLSSPGEEGEKRGEGKVGFGGGGGRERERKEGEKREGEKGGEKREGRKGRGRRKRGEGERNGRRGEKKSARGDDHLNTKYTAQHSLSNVDGNIFRFNASLQIIISYNRQ